MLIQIWFMEFKAMNDYELIMVVLGIIGAIFTALIMGYKFGSKK